MGKFAFQLRFVLGLMACTVLAFGAPIFISDFDEAPVPAPLSGLQAGATFGDWLVGSSTYAAGEGPAVVDRVSSGYWQGPNGSPYSIDLSGTEPGNISTTLSGLTPGSYYNVNFWLSGNPENGQDIKTAQVSFGASMQSVNFDTTGYNTSNMGWMPQSLLFMATSSSAILQFADATPDETGFGAVIGLVSVTAIPEPATMALMGGALLGLALIRRRRAVR